jgi:hypothetical protein
MYMLFLTIWFLNMTTRGFAMTKKEEKRENIITGLCVLAIFGCLYVLLLMAWACQVPIN